MSSPILGEDIYSFGYMNGESFQKEAISINGTPLQVLDQNFVPNIANLNRVLTNSEIVDKPVIIISVAGDTRKGKSLLLNIILRYLYAQKEHKSKWFDTSNADVIYLNGFEWSSELKSNTDGIWVWSEPMYVKGIDYPILLVDTQGTFGDDTDISISTKIFGLSALTSSLLIFNVKERLNNNDLSNLDIFAQVGQKMSHLYGKMRPFQKLLFLIRDWKFDQYKFGFEGGQKYVNDFLKVTEKQSTNLQDIRRRVQESFPDINGFLLPHPGEKVDKGVFLYASDFKHEFRDEINNFVKELFTTSYLYPKTLNGHIITGNQLYNYFTSFINSFNSGEVLTPQSIFDAADLVAVAEASDFYKAELESYQEKGNNELRELRKFNETVIRKTFESFARNPKRYGAVKIDVVLKLFDNIWKVFDQFKSQVEIKHKIIVQEATNTYKSEIQKFSSEKMNLLKKQEFIQKHHESLQKAVTHFVTHPQRCDDVTNEQMTELLNNVWSLFGEEHEKGQLCEQQACSKLDLCIQQVLKIYKQNMEHFLDLEASNIFVNKNNLRNLHLKEMDTALKAFEEEKENLGLSYIGEFYVEKLKSHILISYETYYKKMCEKIFEFANSAAKSRYEIEMEKLLSRDISNLPNDNEMLIAHLTQIEEVKKVFRNYTENEDNEVVESHINRLIVNVENKFESFKANLLSRQKSVNEKYVNAVRLAKQEYSEAMESLFRVYGDFDSNHLSLEHVDKLKNAENKFRSLIGADLEKYAHDYIVLLRREIWELYYNRFLSREYVLKMTKSKKKVALASEAIKICVVGDANVGKTSFILRFIGNHFPEYKEADNGNNVMPQIVSVENKYYNIAIWDMPRMLRPLPEGFYRYAEAIAVVFDVTSEESFKNTVDWMSEIKEHVPSAKIVLIGNKIDLKTERMVSKDKAEMFAKEMKIPYIELSAKTGVKETIDKGVKRIVKLVVDSRWKFCSIS
ncbi:Atlastin-1-like protein [Dinothrombium tinctorium]|uniref:Atlastin-1-like protein n=1 Tax=Dinothrombium tinctorium TaxID=1965070 RepID=A0A443RK61_9ACAR|nr:Atlastin-1-like protein [Dinothrombium tinctorium]